MTDRIDAACMLIFRPSAIGSTLEVLTVSRRGFPDQIGLPGGKREPGDLDPLDTAIRETREETRVVVAREDMHFVYSGRCDSNLCVTYWAERFVAVDLGSPEPDVTVAWKPLIALVTPAAPFCEYNTNLLRAVFGERK